MGGSGFSHYKESDISDLLAHGGQYFPDSGNVYGQSDGYKGGAKKVAESYQSFARTRAGQQMITQMGLPAWDGYAMLDLPGNALAATISYSDGRKILAWNSKYMDRIDAGLLAGPHLEQAVLDAVQRYGHPFADPVVASAADFYEAAFHEGRHNQHGHTVFNRSKESEEFATYRETAQFYRGLAEEVKDRDYAMAKFYEAIADRSDAKAKIYGRGGEGAHVESLNPGGSLESIAGSSDGSANT